MKKLLLIVFIAACTPQQRIARHTKISQRIAAKNNINLFIPTVTKIDTLYSIDTVYVDKIIEVQMPTDTIKETITLEVVNNKIRDISKKYKSKYLNIRIDVKDNEIYLLVALNRKTFKVLIKDLVIKYTNTITKTVTVNVPVNILTWWQNVQIWCGRIFIGSFVIGLLWLILGFRRNDR